MRDEKSGFSTKFADIQGGDYRLAQALEQIKGLVLGKLFFGNPGGQG
jgi:hypothetical protein